MIINNGPNTLSTDISIPIALNIKLKVAKTNSSHTVLYVLKEDKRDESTPYGSSIQR